MQNEPLDPSTNELHKPFRITDIFARPFEKIKLQLRAKKYLTKEDPGGIAYVLRTIKKGDTVFDIGAHKAGYLYFFLHRAGETGKIFAFEPQTVLYKYLSRLKQLFHWENVTIESVAVSNKPGTAVLYVPDNSKGRPSSPSATIIESHEDFTYQLQEEVPTVTLDEYCATGDLSPNFLKVDVEGNELAVFMGAGETLQKHKPKILFECEARFIGEEKVFETFRFLKNLGYKGYFVMGMDLRPIEEFTLISHQSASAKIYCNNFIFE